MADSFQPPAAVQANARKALAWRDAGKANTAGTAVGWARARQLAAGEPVSLDVVERMASYLARHEVDKQGEGFDDDENPSNGRIMWEAWGGDAGRDWARGILEDLRSVDWLRLELMAK